MNCNAIGDESERWTGERDLLYRSCNEALLMRQPDQQKRYYQLLLVVS